MVQSVKDLITDDAPQWAAAIAFHGVLSLFPLLIVAVSIAAYFVSQETAAQELTELVTEFVPRSQDVVKETVQSAYEIRGPAGLLSFLALLWSGSRIFGVLARALNVAWDVDDPYTLRQRLLAEVLMLLTLGLLFIVAVSAGFWIQFLWRVVRGPVGEQDWLYRMVKVAIPPLLLLASFYLLYRFVPRRRPTWPSALVGAGTAVLLFLAARPLFLHYLDSFSRFSVVYGSLAVAMVLLVWAYFLALIVLLGGEIASHTEMIVVEGKSAREVERRHRERSPKEKDRLAQDSEEGEDGNSAG